ncbi:long-chain fatty acid--CoA ligase [Tsuneonella sp. CC-YZS046]|uniref:long-chain fatty acid--CoA ligase n=1 Tax=Tsuneonella sp. CC-YZS046 TaxID=3042152 RepID=UPI002D789EAF|nr:long-chain fatty acid--CoA ligase [Tsuneonella sp. CC-YZS046]WRO67878.1 long-chain fatty acid--CoA ligase [Tsuneonella sp. CC-YZS046]
MLGAMQDWELRVTGLLEHAAREHGSREIVTAWADGRETRTDWAGIRGDALRLVQALRRLGIRSGDRVATLAMNHSRHLVCWFGVPGAGAIVHTLNPRLFDDQLEYIANHAEDRVLIYDAAFQPIVDRMRPRWKTIEHYICFDPAGDPPPSASEQPMSFEEWIGAETGEAEWERGSERDPCMLCYTSGTTGHPKGVLYEHRSTILHTYAVASSAVMAMDARSVVLPVVPMFHANNWGLPWASAAMGAKMVFSAVNEPERLIRLMRAEGATHVAGVPTVWLSLFQCLDAAGEELPPIRQALSGGSALPRALIERLMRADVRVAHAWGMTETSPIATATYEPADWDRMSFEDRVRLKASQGRALFGTEVRAVDLDDPARTLPRDGKSAGALQVRGPWVIKRYFKAETDSVQEAGQWFDTGDVAVIHPDGTVQLTDRTKDVIKSGGEWISSVELENAAVAHPGVAEAAAIGVPHPKWDERPILVVVKKPECSVCEAELRSFLADKVAKWWLPDAVEFVDEIPHTGTGKISKKDLRARFAGYRLES